MRLTRLAEKLFIKIFRNLGFDVGVYIAKLSPKPYVNAVELAGIVFFCVGQNAISSFLLNVWRDFGSPRMR